MSIPTDLMAQASAIGAQDELIEAEAMMLPEGKFSAGALNRLVNELHYTPTPVNTLRSFHRHKSIPI